ncbi:MAG: hypothetical protein R3Y65_01265 [Bacillota bacterium]
MQNKNFNRFSRETVKTRKTVSQNPQVPNMENSVGQARNSKDQTGNIKSAAGNDKRHAGNTDQFTQFTPENSNTKTTAPSCYKKEKSTGTDIFNLPKSDFEKMNT